ncbi:hypothetical protein FOL46_007019 [Perkinsus olseni]|uniref:Uncharacterized protein n=1 Tax=Perkinsus olseni TaxID=32597 RepID=A0A7J6MPK4_PEROL|nr:hypothetical protein FOL46_007019 [Perkinsus olseni]
MVHRKSAPKAPRDHQPLDPAAEPQQDEVVRPEGETSSVKKTKRARRGSRDSSTIDSPRKRSKKEPEYLVDRNVQGDPIDGQGGTSREHKRVIPLTGKLREAVLATHKSGVELKKLKPEFHPDLKVERRPIIEAPAATVVQLPPAESKAQRELVTLQGLYIRLKDIAIHQRNDITRLQTENQRLNGVLQRTMSQCNLYKQQLEHLQQQQTISQPQGLAAGEDLLRGASGTATSLLRQLASAGLLDTTGAHSSASTSSPSQLRAFSAGGFATTSTPSLFPVLKQDNFGEPAPPPQQQATPPVGNTSLLDLLRQNISATDSNTPTPPPFTLPTFPEAKFDSSGQLQDASASNQLQSPPPVAPVAGASIPAPAARSENQQSASLNGSHSDLAAERQETSGTVNDGPSEVPSSSASPVRQADGADARPLLGVDENKGLDVEHPIGAQAENVDA